MQAIVDCSSIFQIKHDLAAGPQSMMVSRVFFTLTIPKKSQHHLFVDISQPYGTDFEKDPIEISRPYIREYGSLPETPLAGPYVIPDQYNGSYNHNDIGDGIEHYYRKQIGSAGGMIRVGAGSSNIKMTGNRIRVPYQFTVQIEEKTAADPW